MAARRGSAEVFDVDFASVPLARPELPEFLLIASSLVAGGSVATSQWSRLGAGRTGGRGGVAAGRYSLARFKHFSRSGNLLLATPPPLGFGPSHSCVLQLTHDKVLSGPPDRGKETATAGAGRAHKWSGRLWVARQKNLFRSLPRRLISLVKGVGNIKGAGMVDAKRFWLRS